jgi:hypothetical protein
MAIDSFYADLLEDEEEKTLTRPELTPTTPPVESGIDITDPFYSDLVEEEEEPEEINEATAITARKNIEGNSAVRDAAVRFVQERLGMTNVTDPDVAMEEYIEHFRSFNVNEITAGGDYRYVSAAAADATKTPDLTQETRDKAAQRLSDYRLLYQTFNEMPAFSDGFFTATGDYAEGILKAPSTYLGLLLPGAGKAGGIAAQTGAKVAVNRTLAQALKTPVTTLASKAAANPIKTTVIAEGIGGSLQNVAAQNTEITADLRDDYNPGETALAFGLSAALPAAGVVYAGKGGVKKYIEKDTPDLVAKVLKQEEEATIEAAKTLTKNKTNKKLAKQVKDSLPSLRALDENEVAKGKIVRDTMQEGKDLEPDFNMSMTPEKTLRVYAGMVELAAEAGLEKAPEERITEFVARAFEAVAKKDPEKAEKLYGSILEKYKLTHGDFGAFVMADASDWGRRGAAMAQAKRLQVRLNNAAANKIFGLDEQALKKIKELEEAVNDGDVRLALTKSDDVDNKAEVDGLFRKLDTVRLAAMTSQTATTVRNGVGGFGRAGIDGVTKLVDRGIASGLKTVGFGKGKKGFNFSDPNSDAMSVIYGMMNTKESSAIKEIFSMGFDQKAEALYRQLRDIDGKTGKKKGMNASRAIAMELNALNQLTDNFFKQAAFSGSLKRQLNEAFQKQLSEGKDVTAKDFNLLNIIEDGKFQTIFGDKRGQAMLDKAIKDSLYFTYQATPNTAAGKAFVSAIHSAPFLTTSLVPFPRFIMNALRFTYEYSPAYVFQGFARSFAKDSDNYEEISKALIGTGILAGAVAFRGSENAGERWYEYKMDDGRTYDMRPFFPAAPYLFFADLYVKAKNNDPVLGDSRFVADALQALTGTQMRAGFGAYAIDGAIRDLLRDDQDSSEKLKKITAEYVANLFSTYTIPLTAGQDIANTWLSPDDEVIARQTKSSNLFDLIVTKSTARIPMNYALQKNIQEFTSQSSWLPQYTAPEAYQPGTRDEPLRRQIPITRQVAGILLRDRRNFLEEEMARLKISPRKLLQKTGVPEADTLIGDLIGEYAVEYIVPILQNSEEYKSLNGAEQAIFLKSVIDDYKADIMKLARYRSQYEGRDKYGFDVIAKSDFNKLNSTYQNKAFEEYDRTYGKPKEGENYDYKILTEMGRSWQKIFESRQ